MRVLPAPASMSPAHTQWVLLAVTPAALAPSHSACLMYAATTSVYTAITHDSQLLQLARHSHSAECTQPSAYRLWRGCRILSVLRSAGMCIFSQCSLRPKDGSRSPARIADPLAQHHTLQWQSSASSRHAVGGMFCALIIRAGSTTRRHWSAETRDVVIRRAWGQFARQQIPQ